jgi:hypothetical protein
MAIIGGYMTKTIEVIKLMRRQRTPEQLESFKRLLKNKILSWEVEKHAAFLMFNSFQGSANTIRLEADRKQNELLKIQLTLELEEAYEKSRMDQSRNY